jgi:dihydroorotate dehydrogenase electron transfer subunit
MTKSRVRIPASSPLSLPGWRRTPRYEVQATVAAHRPIIGHEFELVFHAPAIADIAQPGQFVEILFGENYAPLVRRPFSLYRVDRVAGVCSVLYLARGSFTTGLARKQPGDVVSLLGPLGRPFHWTSEPGTQHILVAGGLGAPPLYFLASELSRSLAASAARGGTSLHRHGASGTQILSAAHTATEVREARLNVDGELEDATMPEAGNSRLIVINAARTESLLVGLSEFGELDIALHVMTDDGSRGTKGMATELLTTLLEAEQGDGVARAIYACGPMAMLRSVGEIAVQRELPCQLSIETTMPCGIGLCQGCATPVHDASSPAGFSYALACVDGPVFEARDLVWT